MSSQSSLREEFTENEIEKFIQEEVKSGMKEAKNDLTELKRIISLLVQNANGSNTNLF